MEDTLYKLSEDAAEAIRASMEKMHDDFADEVTQLSFKDIVDGTSEKARKIKQDNGTFDVIISTELKDRAGEIVRQDGWDMSDYKNNPIVLWGHDYYSLGIGVCMETYNTTFRGVPALGARGVFYDEAINPLAQQVRRMYDFGVKMGTGAGCTTSVGFIPKEFDPNDQSIITRSELLEFSFVPVPANQGVGPAQGRALTMEEANALGLDVVGLKAKGLSFMDAVDAKGYVPKDVSDKKAPEDTPWSKPSLKDFTDKSWEELSESEIKHIAGHYAWGKENPPATFGDLKLPHHRPSDGAVVWNGVKAAMGALMGARGGVEVDGDKKAVYNHLAAHYKQFEKEPPEFKETDEEEVEQKADTTEQGDSCNLRDGTPGTLQPDENGDLVCVPTPAKAAEDMPAMQEEGMHKAIDEEQDRHTKAIEKCFKAFKGGEDEKAMKKALSKLSDAMDEEQGMHKSENVKLFRSFIPPKQKAKDGGEDFMKSLKEEHKAYDEKCNKSIDEFSEKMLKTVAGDMHDNDEDDGNSHTDWITGQIADHSTSHNETVKGIASEMAKAFNSTGEEIDERAIAELIIRTAQEIGADDISDELAEKIGARLSKNTRKKLEEAHDSMMKGIAIIRALHGGLGHAEPDGDEGGEDMDNDGDGKKDVHGAPVSEDLREFVTTRDLVRTLSGILNESLSKSNETIRNYHQRSKY